MSVHDNSSSAYHEVCKKGRVAERRRMLMQLASFGGTFTDREAAGLLGFQDMNAVRPRITEMIRDGDLIERESIRDEQTGRTVRTWGKGGAS